MLSLIWIHRTNVPTTFGREVCNNCSALASYTTNLRGRDLPGLVGCMHLHGHQTYGMMTGWRMEFGRHTHSSHLATYHATSADQPEMLYWVTYLDPSPFCTKASRFVGRQGDQRNIRQGPTFCLHAPPLFRGIIRTNHDRSTQSLPDLFYRPAFVI